MAVTDAELLTSSNTITINVFDEGDKPVAATKGFAASALVARGSERETVALAPAGEAALKGDAKKPVAGAAITVTLKTAAGESGQADNSNHKIADDRRPDEELRAYRAGTGHKPHDRDAYPQGRTSLMGSLSDALMAAAAVPNRPVPPITPVAEFGKELGPSEWSKRCGPVSHCSDGESNQGEHRKKV